MVDMVNHPPHYTTVPPGLFGECIEYVRPMGYSQGAAFKYLFRAGAKGDINEDLGKAAWYLNDAINHGTALNVLHLDGYPRIDPNVTHRSKALHYLAHGRLDIVLKAIDQFGPRITEERNGK